MDTIAELTARMIEFNAGEPALTQHLLKVHAFARTMGVLEGLDAEALNTLEMAALTHDIGIKVCLEKYGACTGPMQEQEGPPLAAPMLAALNVPDKRAERVCYLIGHHHTYDAIDGADYQILVEADFLVNLFEGNQDAKAKERAYERIFKTKTGRQFFQAMYG